MRAASSSAQGGTVPTAGDYLTAGDGPGQWRWPLPDREVVTIGRDPGMDLCLDSDERVSRRHAQLRRSAGQWWIADLSTNGTFVNDRRLTDWWQLRDRDRIRIGGTDLTFHTGVVHTVIESPPSRHGASARVRTGRVMLIAIVAKGIELALNSVLTFVTDRLGSGRWLVSNAGVLFIAVAIALFDAFGHREPPPADTGTTADRATSPARRGTPALAALLVVLLLVGVGGYAATAGVRYAVGYASGVEAGPDRLVKPVTKNATGLTLTVQKVLYTKHFTRVELSVRNTTSSTSITMPLFENCVFSGSDGTTLRADSFKSQWTKTVPPGALQRGTITFPGHLPDRITRASLSFGHTFGSFNVDAISIRGIALKTAG